MGTRESNSGQLHCRSPALAPWAMPSVPHGPLPFCKGSATAMSRGFAWSSRSSWQTSMDMEASLAATAWTCRSPAPPAGLRSCLRIRASPLIRERHHQASRGLIAEAARGSTWSGPGPGSWITARSPMATVSNSLCQFRGIRWLPERPVRDSRLDGKKVMVPRRGLEPPRPCERQHLKLVRLPIPPPGHGLRLVGRRRRLEARARRLVNAREASR